jgi:hypothetical protein
MALTTLYILRIVSLLLPMGKEKGSTGQAIIAKKQGYYYCRLHPEIKNAHLESIEHHIKYKDPKWHESELLKFGQDHSQVDDSIDR